MHGLSQDQKEWAKEKHPDKKDWIERTADSYDNPFHNTAHRNIQEEYYKAKKGKVSKEDKESYKKNCGKGPHGGFK